MSLDELEGALLVGLAAAARTFHQALVAEGFTQDQALHLVTAWQTSWLEAVREPDPTRSGPPAP